MTTQPAGDEHPTALISWAHRDPDWDDATAARRLDDVLRLAQQLRANGVDCDLDAFHPNEDWTRWGPRRVGSVDVVLIVASKAWRHAWEGTGDPRKHIGASAEADALRTFEARGRGELRKRCRLVLLPGSDDSDIPVGMHGIQRYAIPADEESLLRDLTGQPAVVAAPLGPVPVLPPSMGSADDVGHQAAGDAESVRDQLAALPTPRPDDGADVRWVQARNILEALAAQLSAAPAAPAHAPEAEPVRWIELPEPGSVSWRAEWPLWHARADGAVVVLHVLPHPRRSFSRRLRGELQTRLVRGLRELALVAPDAGIVIVERDETIGATKAVEHRRYDQVMWGGFAGYRLAASGQISVWFNLSKDSMGAVLDETEVVRHLRAGLDLAAVLLDNPDLQATDQSAVALAVELDETSLLTDGTLADLGHRTTATMGFFHRQAARVPAEEAVYLADLRGGGADIVAATLTSLIIKAWGR